MLPSIRNSPPTTWGDDSHRLRRGGISFGMEETFQPYIARGELVTLLDAWLPAFAGFYLYFPSRKNLAPKLRALIDHVRL